MTAHLVSVCVAAFAIACSLPAATPIGGTITNQILTADRSPFVMTSDVTATNLVIEAGVSIESQSNFQFIVTGLLIANGLPSSPISFKPSPGNPSWQGILFQSASPACVISNCTISGAINSGIRIQNTPLTIRNVLLAGNQSSSGGGIASDSSLLLEDCVVSNCTAYSGTSARGGGIWMYGTSDKSLTLRRCTFVNNSANYWGSSGGAVLTESGTLVVQDCTFMGNSAYGHIFEGRNIGVGGGIWSGGPLYCTNSLFSDNYISSQVGSVGGAIRAVNNATLIRCSIVNNSAYTHDGEAWGAGLHCDQSATLNNCVISGNSITTDFAWSGYGAGVRGNHLDMTNCILADNHFFASSQYHFGSALSGNAGSIVNCTIVNNYTANGPYRWALFGFSGAIKNSIIFGNDDSFNDAPVISYSLVQGIGANPDHNFDLNPLFADTTNYYLSYISPAVDAGDPSVAYNDLFFPPSLGTSTNDMGAYGGPGAIPVLGFVPPLTIVAQPISLIRDYGSSATFSVAATGGYGPITYQWQHNGTNIVGATNSSVVLMNIDFNASGSYSAIVSNITGTLSSSAASLSVTRTRCYFGHEISGIVGRSYLIEYSTNLSGPTNWNTLTNIVLLSNPSKFFDADSPDSESRIYRFTLLSQ